MPKNGKTKRARGEKEGDKEEKSEKKGGKNLLKKVLKRRENRLTNTRKKYKMNKPCARGRIILPKIRLKKADFKGKTAVFLLKYSATHADKCNRKQKK